MPRIRGLARSIARQCEPRKVVLFGSHARGDARPDSDVDLLVITDDRPGPDASLKIRRAVRYDFPLDLIVCDLATLDRRIDAGDFFLQDALHEGKVLYERPAP